VKALEERFAPPNQTELYRVQLTERRQKPTESLPELGQAIRRLVNLVYPTVPENVRPFHFLTIDLYESKHQSETYNLTMMMYIYHHRLQLLHVQYLSL
jgi:hypothetical protein